MGGVNEQKNALHVRRVPSHHKYEPIRPVGFSNGIASNTLILGVLSQFKHVHKHAVHCSFCSFALPETQHQLFDKQTKGSSQVESLEKTEVSDWSGTSE